MPRSSPLPVHAFTVDDEYALTVAPTIAAGYSVVVDLDLEKFFDRVNHDSLMARVAARVTDKRMVPQGVV